ncbi:2-oxo acid dehydrogenase subunit E2 [bacterium]|nr:2-oxo acid dehydrogenase subunit E2 [Candidatus Neomarinimicrobiota bacterium]MDC0645742.1 2-oxo acid dehydrogenase subunit E2 [bacterium]MDC1038312.1 dihydrolipoamide acetyltransferase family protein [Candidatus Neomarinimicrobiota bacterium]
MIIDVIMPKMGESITEGTILEWRKKIGEFIELDEILLEIGTDKVDSEIPSSAAGVLVEILAEPNDVKDVGVVIAKIDTDGGGSSVEIASKEPTPIPRPEPEIVKAVEPKPIISVPATSTGEKKFYTPVVMKIVAEKGLPLGELEMISGSGRSGRVTKKDVLAYIANRGIASAVAQPVAMPAVAYQTPSSTPVPVSSALAGRTVEMHHMRKLIAEHMRESINTSAHVYVMTEVDMTPIVEMVESKGESFLSKEGFKLTYTPFTVDAVVKALQDFPEMNSSIFGTSVTYHKNINVGLAVAIENGLMVPAMFNCEEKNFLGLCRAVNDVAKRTRSKQISADELSGSTFTITNFGVFGVTVGTPIINQPNVGILGVGAIKKQPVVVESPQGDAIAIRSMMMLSLGFDHRLIDGASGAKFLERVRHYLETMNLETVL